MRLVALVVMTAVGSGACAGDRPTPTNPAGVILAVVGITATTIGALEYLDEADPFNTMQQHHDSKEVLFFGGLVVAGVGALVAAVAGTTHTSDAELAAANAELERERAAAAAAAVAEVPARERARAAAAELDRKRRARDGAWAAFARADAAARESNCEAVRKLDAQVAELDVDFHATIFVHDAAIARCLPEAETAGEDAPAP